ncbi:MAG: pyruvate dehydrogenase (acetyl-transferring) E1 component subunit alpha [Eubacteriales bacterium]|nr:pyruvate dehydrogenase (acetyl-transferring) E1 component subunit alpha [Eubacteriales bacterium]
MVVKGYEKKQLLDFYKTMLTIRRFEEQTFEFYKRGLMAGLAHLYMGEEAVATGVCGALNEKDYIGSTHRGHGHLIARGADLDKMMAEILGKKTGYSNGKGGSMHIMAMDKGILGANGIVGGEIPIATGAAYSAKYRKTDQVSIAFLGDGASNEGTFHESVNMAAAWHLPCIYVIENNLYGISVDIRDVTNTPDLSVRAKGYNIPGVTVDGMDVTAVYEAAKEAVARARAGEGPTIIEAKTYRWQGHHVGDPAVYRSRKSKTEKEDWMKKDPIKNLKAAMMEENLASADEFEKIEADVEADIAAAAKFAEESDYPAAEDAFNNIFA